MARLPGRWLLWAPIFAIGLFLFFASLVVGKSHDAVVGDAVGNYVYLQSLATDGDLDLANQLRQHGLRVNVTPNGRAANRFPIGTALLEAPFFLAGRAVTLAGRALGAPWPADAWTPPEQIGFALGAIFWAALGLELAYRLARRLTGEREAALGATAWLVASALPYYIFRDSGYPHACSFFAVTALLWYDQEAGALRPRVAFGLGIVLALAAMVENQNVLYAVVPLWRRRQEIFAHPTRLALAALGLLVGFLPQMIVWQIIFGAPLVFSYAATGMQDRVQPLAHLGQVLFSSNHGLVLWHPIAGLAIVGLLAASASRPYLGALGLQWLVNGSWWFWSFGVAFGSRKFLSASAIFVLGVAHVARAAQTRPLRLALLALFALLALWNVILALLFVTHSIPTGGPVSASQLADGLGRLLSAIRARF